MRNLDKIAFLSLLCACSDWSLFKGDSGAEKSSFTDADSEGRESPRRRKKPEDDDSREITEAMIDCPSVALHENMSSCDYDDLEVQRISSLETPSPSSVQESSTSTVTSTSTITATSTATSTSVRSSADPNVVEFRIKAGTANQPWNTADTAVRAKRGQIIRIFNDDSIIHRLHTNGAPCPHGNNINPGASADCVTTRAYDSKTSAPIYDHIAGPAALFHVTVTE